MELALRRSYGYAFAPPLNRWGMQGLGQLCSDGSDPGDDGACPDGDAPTFETDQYGATCQVASMVGGNCPGSAPVSTVSSPTGTALTSTPTTAAANSYLIVDSTGVTWTCDSNGNCCNPSMICQQGPPTILTTAPPNATAAQNASSAASNQSTAALVAALATAAAAAGKSVVGAAGSIQCSAGVAVPAGTKCPGATGTSVCPAGSTLIGTTCSASIIPGLSNSTLMIGAVVVLAVMMMGKKK
jgi:hypothetical protein